MFSRQFVTYLLLLIQFLKKVIFDQMRVNLFFLQVAFILISLVFCSYVEAQTKFESETQILERLEILQSKREISPVELIDYLDAMLKESEEKSWKQATLAVLITKMEALIDLEEIATAYELFLSLQPLANRLNNDSYNLRLELAELPILCAQGRSEGIAGKQDSLLARAEDMENRNTAGEVYLTVAESQYFFSNFEAAINSFASAYDAFEDAGNKSEVGHVLSSLGNISVEMNNIELAIDYFYKAMKVARGTGDQFAMSILLYNLSNAYFSVKEYGNAKQYMDEALRLSAELGDNTGVAFAQQGLANIFLIEENWVGAIEMFNNSEKTFFDAGNINRQFDSLIGQVEPYLKLEQVEKAADKLNQSRPLLAIIKDPTIIAKHVRAESKLELLKGNSAIAYQLLEKYVALRDEVFANQQKQDIQKYRVQFDVKLKENENKALLIKNELSTLKINQEQKLQKFWIAVFVLSVALLIVLIWMLYKQTLNRNHFKAMALKDHLTNSPNRRAVLHYAGACFKEASSTDAPLSIGIIDLDFFKRVNDRYGHEAGDEVLKSFASACTKAIRQQDGFGRYGGEEWLFVFNNTNKEQIELIFNRLRDAVNKDPINGIPSDHEITFSMGVAVFDKANDRNVRELISRADKKLYQAKDFGRDRIAF